MTVLNQPDHSRDAAISELVARLHETQERLRELTGGEVDAVVHQGGQSYLLHEAQETLRQSELAQRENAETQIAILNALPAQLALLDRAGAIVSVNEAWRTFGTSNGLQGSDFGIGVNYLELCERAVGECSEDAVVVAAGLRRVLSGQIPSFTLEYPCHSPTEKRWFRLLVTPLGGTRGGAVVLHLDVTERVLSVEALRESEVRFRGTFEQAAVGIAHICVEGRFLRVNDKLCQILGYGRDELPGMSAAELTLAEDLAGGMEARRAMLAGEITDYSAERRYRRKDGRLVWLDLATTLQRAPGGEVQYFISVCEDVTARKQAEFRLHRLNRLHTVLSKSGEAIVRTPDRLELYETVCRIMVKDGLLPMACIVGLDAHTGRHYAEASWGMGREMLGGMLVAARGGPPVGPTSTTIRTGRHEVCNDLESDSRLEVWHGRMRSLGFRATASFPLKLGAITIGALVLFANETGYFQEDEVRIMVAVAGELSFALEAYERDLSRQAAEDRARRQGALLLNAQRIARMGSWNLDVGRGALAWSEATCELFGVSPAGFEGTFTHFQRFMLPEDRAAYDAAQARVTPEAPLVELEYRIRRPDGAVRWMYERGNVQFDAAGRVTGRAGMVMDVTEQHEAREQLAQNAALLRIAGRSAKLGGWTIELPAKTLVWSDENCLIHDVPPGYRPSFEEGLNFYPPESRVEVRRLLETCAAEGIPYDFEMPKLTARGRPIWVRSIGEAVRDAEGQIIRLQGAIQDITERKRVEERLREQDALIRIAGRLTRTGGWAVELPAQKVFWSDEIFDLLEVPRGQIPPLAEALAFYPEPWRAKVAAALELCAHEGTTFDLEVEVNTVGERRIWVRICGEAVRLPDGTIRRLAGAFQDISERKRMELQALRTQRMDSIGTLASGIAHDLNNSLAPIIMALELLKLRFPDDESQELLAAIRTSAQRGADMVRQLLSFGRGVEGRRLEVQVGHLVREVEKIANDTFLKHIEIRTLLPRDLWTVLGDPTQLHQVLLNLCVNARDAMPHGGTLTLSAGNTRVEKAAADQHPGIQPGPFVLLQVADTGEGMSAKIVESIFDPFFTTKEIGKGTGLGLSTSLAIVQSHGGFFQVVSQPGEGTTFKVFLPAQTEISPAVLAKRAADLPHGHGELILVVDDEPAVRQITKKMLETFGYRVVLAADGAEAVVSYATCKPDAVLTDLMMPILNGIATIEVLHRMDPHLPIIAASGLSQGSDAAESERLGVTHFLPKPYAADVLLRTLQQVLAARRRPK